MHSMTGFGRGAEISAIYQAVVEISAVNRKNAEVVIQLPKSLLGLEAGIKKFLLSQVSRGRLQVNIKLTSVSDVEPEIEINEAVLEGLISVAKKIESATGTPQKVTLSDVITLGSIFKVNEQELDEKQASDVITPAVEQALTGLLKMRRIEGEHLSKDIESRILSLEETVRRILERAPKVVKNYRESLLQRLEDASIPVDLSDERLLREIGLFAEKSDIAEETSRLESHFLKFREYFNSEEAVGRSLDFLCQEMNREFNTIGSKANDATLAQYVVICKTELEKVREQVQNIE